MPPPPIRQLKAVFNRVRDLMAASGDPCSHYFGSEFLPDNYEAGFRYTWVPTADTFDSPYQGGNAGYDDGPSNPRALFTRTMGVEVHCWGAVLPPDDAADPDVYYDAGDLMALNLIAWLRRAVGPNFKPTNGAWVGIRNQTTGQYGRVYVLRLGIDAPSPDKTYTLAEIRKIIVDTYYVDPATQTEELVAHFEISTP